MTTNLVGEVKSENPNQAERLEFLALLEDLMATYKISSVNVGWAYGTDFTAMEKALQDELKEDEAQEPAPEAPVCPRNVTMFPGPDITPKKPFKKQGGLAAGGIPEGDDRLDVLDGVVSAMDDEDANNQPEVAELCEHGNVVPDPDCGCGC